MSQPPPYNEATAPPPQAIPPQAIPPQAPAAQPPYAPQPYGQPQTYPAPGYPAYQAPPGQAYGQPQQVPKQPQYVPQQQGFVQTQQPQATMVVVQPTVGSCPYCHRGVVREEVNTVIVVLTIVCCFFIGVFSLLFLLCLYKRTCSACGREI